MMQTHLNDLARRYSQDRVKQARSYLKSIFDEAIEQEFLVKDPTRKLKTPKNLRPKDKRVLELGATVAGAGQHGEKGLSSPHAGHDGVRSVRASCSL